MLEDGENTVLTVGMVFGGLFGSMWASIFEKIFLKPLSFSPPGRFIRLLLSAATGDQTSHCTRDNQRNKEGHKAPISQPPQTCRDASSGVAF